MPDKEQAKLNLALLPYHSRRCTFLKAYNKGLFPHPDNCTCGVADVRLALEALIASERAAERQSVIDKIETNRAFIQIQIDKVGLFPGVRDALLEALSWLNQTLDDIGVAQLTPTEGDK